MYCCLTISRKGFLVDTLMINRDLPTGIEVVAEEDMFEATAYELDSQRQYYAIAFAETSTGGIYYGYPISFLTTRVVSISMVECKATNILARTAALSGKVGDDSGVAASRFGVKYWVASEQEPNDDVTLFFPGAPTHLVAKGETFSTGISGLEPNTAYRVRIYGQNDSQGSYCEPFEFRTLAVVAPQAKIGAEPKQSDGTLTPSTALIKGCKMLHTGNELDIVYGAAYKLNPGSGEVPDNTWTKVEATVVLRADSTFDVHITQLLYDSNYAVAAYVSNTLFTGYSNTIAFTTLNATAPVVTVLKYTPEVFQQAVGTTGDYNIGITYAYLKGEMVSNGGLAVEEYGFYLGTDPTLAGADRVITGTTEPSGQLSIKVASLTPGTTYYYALFVKSEFGEGMSDIASLTTAIDGGMLLVTDVYGTNGTPATFKAGATPLIYYELPPVVSATTKYFMLDRNLGATRQVGEAQIAGNAITVDLKEYVGYYYQYGYPTPATTQDTFDLLGLAACDGGAGTTFTYGWNTEAQADRTTWAGTNDPCPAGYRLPTTAELTEIISVLSSTDFSVMQKALKLTWSGIRNQNRGGLGTATGSCLWASNQNAAANVRTLDSSVAGFMNNNNKNAGMPVRCLRTEPITP